jgi:hypothetical protein
MCKDRTKDSACSERGGRIVLQRSLSLYKNALFQLFYLNGIAVRLEDASLSVLL